LLTNSCSCSARGFICDDDLASDDGDESIRSSGMDDEENDDRHDDNNDDSDSEISRDEDNDTSERIIKKSRQNHKPVSLSKPLSKPQSKLLVKTDKTTHTNGIKDSRSSSGMKTAERKAKATSVSLRRKQIVMSDSEEGNDSEDLFDD
jgi:hypothetical protein